MGLHLSLVMEGHIDYNEYLDRVIEGDFSKDHDLKRIEMILDIYVSELKPSYNKVTDIRTELNEIVSQHKQAYKNGDFDGRRFLKPYQDVQLKLEKSGSLLKNEIASCAKNT